MLLPGEAGFAFANLCGPALAQATLVLVWVLASANFKAKLVGHPFWGPHWKYFVGGMMLPGLVQWVYILIGALIFEAIEMANEEDGNADFSRCLTNYTRAECRAWVPLVGEEAQPELEQSAMYAALGDPGSPWRNFDMYGSAFFCFTLITTIGYGTFAPATTGGKIFACVYLLVGIPLNLALFAELGKNLSYYLFESFIVGKYKSARAGLATSADADADGSGSISFDEVKAALNQGSVSATDDQIRALIAEVDDGDGTLSPTEYDKLCDKLAELSASRLEVMLNVSTFILSIVLWSALLPLSDPDTFGAVDGMYWAFITFSTVGLGDYTISLASEHSLHGQFTYWYRTHATPDEDCTPPCRYRS